MRSIYAPDKTQQYKRSAASNINLSKARSPKKIVSDAIASRPAPFFTADSLGIKQLKSLQVMADSHLNKNLLSGKPIQMAVIESGFYSVDDAHRDPTQAAEIREAWKKVNSLVPLAEQKATAGVKEDDPNKRTKTQNAYVRNSTRALWGSCVEEQLNGLISTDWQQQVLLDGSRPDYKMTAGGIDTYADLTTPAEAGITGKHITQKLQTANVLRGAVVAADITYGAQQVQPAEINAWHLTAFRAQQLHEASASGNGDVVYIPWAVKNKVPDDKTIWDWGKSKCLKYAEKVNKQIDADDFFEKKERRSRSESPDEVMPRKREKSRSRESFRDQGRRNRENLKDRKDRKNSPEKEKKEKYT